MSLTLSAVDVLNNVATTVTTGASSATQTVGSTTNMAAGDVLWFAVSAASRIVSSVTNATTVVLTATISTTTAEAVTKLEQGNAAGAGTVTTAGQDVSAAYLKTARIRIDNQTTGPTVAGAVTVQIAEANVAGDYMALATITGGLTATTTYEAVVEIPDTAQWVRFVYGSNTIQIVSFRIVIDKTTGL
jgi:hypothetical protein